MCGRRVRRRFFLRETLLELRRVVCKDLDRGALTLRPSFYGKGIQFGQ
jgi:hypothetical protein